VGPGETRSLVVKFTRLRERERAHKADRGSRPCHQRFPIGASVGRQGRGPSGSPARGPYEAGSPGKNSAISRAADSWESDPCTRFSVVSIPRSPRMVPGAASAGLVVPIMRRTTA
jgi:hypothetical protein